MISLNFQQQTCQFSYPPTSNAVLNAPTEHHAAKSLLERETSLPNIRRETV